MKKEINIQTEIKELDALRKTAEETIKKYNKISKRISFETRLGLAVSEINLDEIIKDRNDMLDLDGSEKTLSKPKNIDKWLNDNYEEIPYVDIFSPLSDGWFPSSINC